MCVQIFKKENTWVWYFFNYMNVKNQPAKEKKAVSN